MSKYITIGISAVFTVGIHEPVAQRRCEGNVQNELVNKKICFVPQ